MAWNIIVGSLLALIILLGGGLVAGELRWVLLTRRRRARLQQERKRPVSSRYDPRELEGLPTPVRCYFQAVLQPGQPLVMAASLVQRGTLNLGDSQARWLPFTSTQTVVTRRPGFLWSARIPLLPGLAVRVHDAYLAGEGVLLAALGGLVPVAARRGTPDMAEGELMRFLAEAAWYPTALLPSQGVRWLAQDEQTAWAEFRDGNTVVRLRVRFGPDHLIQTVYVPARGRLVGDQVIPTAWEGRFGDYQWRAGMRVPLHGEVSWLLATGPRPYWRGRITRLAYEFTSH